MAAIRCPELNMSNRLQPVSLTHPFGTDHFGRDMLSMIMVGAQTSIAVAFVAVGIGVLFGVPLGYLPQTGGRFHDDGVCDLTIWYLRFQA